MPMNPDDTGKQSGQDPEDKDPLLSVDEDELERMLSGGDSAPQAPSKDDSPPSSDSGDSSDDSGDDDDERSSKVDEELSAAANDTEREAIRERRREERRLRKERGRQKVAEMDRKLRQLAEQNAQLQEQVAQLSNHTAGAQMAQLEQEIARSEQAATQFKKIIADATAKGDGNTVAEATELMIEARERAKQLALVKEARARAAAEPRERRAPAIDPGLLDHGTKFLSKHTWYKGARASDPDSRVMTAVDNSLAAEGWDPGTEGYWKELESRAKKYLPHRFATQPPATGDNPVRRSPVVGSNSGASNSGGSGQQQFTLSSARVQAMKDAGIWDDPARRAKMIRAYQKADAESKS